MERLLTISQLSRLTGRTRNTLRTWCQKGRISSKNEDGQILISLSEAMRIWPDLQADRLEQELAQRAQKFTRIDQHVQSEQVSSTEQVGALFELKARVRELELMLEQKDMMINMLKSQLSALSADKALFTDLIKSQSAQLDQALGRLLPQRSSAGRTSNQSRDQHGRFVGTGKGVGALLQGDLLTSDDE